MARKIIGAGLGRTGTFSLYTALNQLGFPCCHMLEVLKNEQNKSHLDFRREVANSEPGRRTTGARDSRNTRPPSTIQPVAHGANGWRPIPMPRPSRPSTRAVPRSGMKARGFIEAATRLPVDKAPQHPAHAIYPGRSFAFLRDPQQSRMKGGRFLRQAACCRTKYSAYPNTSRKTEYRSRGSK